MKLKSLSLVAAVAGASVANAGASALVTEFMFNPGGADGGFEYVEIQGTPGATFTGLYILSIEGDLGAVGGVGAIDQKIALPSITIGANGLALIRQGSVALTNAPDPETTVVTQTWSPDIENGTNTYALVQSANPFWVGLTDLDTNDDGTIDDASVLNGLTVLGAFGAFDGNNENGDKAYGVQLGGVDFVRNVPLGTSQTGNGYGVFYAVLNTAGTAVNGYGANSISGANVGPYTFGTFASDFSRVTPAIAITDIVEANPGRKNVQWPLNATSTISGNLVLENTADDGVAGTETITWTLSNGVNSYTSDFTVNDFGGGAYSFDIPAAAANGAYTLSFDGGTFLKSTFNVTLSGSSLTQAVSLRNGDIDNDTEVGPGDFEAVVAQFGGPGDADVDNDGEVGPADFEIVIANFGLGDN
jgi:hypothetical protein